MHVLIIGSGYVGLVLGACLAEIGNHVILHDIDPVRIEMLQGAKAPFYESGLDDLLQHNQTHHRMTFTTDLKAGLKASDICFIAVPTPSAADGSCNLNIVYSVAKEIANNLDHHTLIAIKSTVPVGTTKKVQQLIRETNPHASFDIVSNPEFLQEGTAVHNCMHPDRVVIGHDSPAAAELLGKLFSSFDMQNSQILTMDFASSEMTKYASNMMLASRISMVNELSWLCEQFGANIHSVQLGMSQDPRIGSLYLNAGIGFGGSCLPKDLSALQHLADIREIDSPMMHAIAKVNRLQQIHFVDKIRHHYNTDSLKGRKFAVLGAAFKGGTDDTRDSPAISVISHLTQAGASICIYDPLAMPNAQTILADSVSFTEDPYTAINDADALLLLTDWSSFKELDFTKIKELLREPIIFDGKNYLPKEGLVALGFTYFGMGL